jgi:threonine/homoserine efflux transporter RhtA
MFLLTGFASRVCGLLLACLGAWLLASYGPSIASIAEPPVGVYLMLRGGGAWAMDIYVQKMQDRARQL